MKYFTPELYARLQDRDDSAMNAADADWERAVDDYNRRLEEIRSELPDPILTLLKESDFHDARVLSLAEQDGAFVIVLEPESPPRELAILIYSLTSAVAIDRTAIPEGLRSPVVEWLFDEWDVLPGSGEFSHEILLSNGWHVGVRFHRVQVVKAHALLRAEDRTPTNPMTRSA